MTVPAGDRIIAVFGAYGHTARFVVAELWERGWTPVLSGRDAARLATVAAGSHPVLESRRAIAGAAAVRAAVAGGHPAVEPVTRHGAAGPMRPVRPAVWPWRPCPRCWRPEHRAEEQS